MADVAAFTEMFYDPVFKLRQIVEADLKTLLRKFPQLIIDINLRYWLKDSCPLRDDN